MILLLVVELEEGAEEDDAGGAVRTIGGDRLHGVVEPAF